MKPDAYMPVSGEPVWYLEPQKTKVKWSDIAVHLTNIKRYNGGIPWPLVSHLYLVCEMVIAAEDRGYLAGLEINDLLRVLAIHDIHECYIGDVTSGLKKHLPDFRFVEGLWADHIHKSFFGDWKPTPDILLWADWIDKRAVVLETWVNDSSLYHKLGENIEPWECEIVQNVNALGKQQTLNQLRFTIERLGGTIHE